MDKNAHENEVLDTTLPDDIAEDCKATGIGLLQIWLNEHDIKLPDTQEKNFYSSLAKGLETNVLTIDKLYEGIAEIEENSNKKIYLYAIDDVIEFQSDIKNIYKHLKLVFGITLSSKNYVRSKPSNRSTFIYMYESDWILKIKYSETQFNMEADFETSSFKKTPDIVTILFVFNFNTGVVQLRLDAPGNIHNHKNDEGKSTEAAFENYYKNLLKELFPKVNFTELNLNGVANYIATTEKNKFRINRGVTTITNNAKQTFASSSTKSDVRDLPEYEAAASKGLSIWRTEDLTGIWLAAMSEGALKKDLFMRISRKSSVIRVQRGCLEKELNYGMDQIREIQEKI